jgi:hypothetical protein
MVTFGFVVLLGVIDLPNRVTAATNKQTNYHTPFYQELHAKKWLLKYDPQPARGFGMPSYDTRSKKQIAQEALQSKQAAKKFVKDNPELVDFLHSIYLRASYVYKKPYDEQIYQIKQTMDLIKLEKTDTGFTYHFQSGGGCFVREYSGTLIMNGNSVTDETMEMHEHGTPC